MKTKIYNLILFILAVCIISLFAYREFLNLYRSMLLDDFFSYYHYQNQIIYFETGDIKYRDYLPMNIRFLGLFLQYFIFKILPCLTITNVPSFIDKNELFVCATYSLAVMNHLFKYFFIVLFFLYMLKKMNRSLVESVIGLFLASILVHYVENYTFDRLTIFIILLILFFENNKILSGLFLFLSFLVNEKIIMVLGPYYFIQFIFIDRSKFFLFFIGLANVLFYYLLLLFSNYYLGYEYAPLYNNSNWTRILLDLTDKSHLSNSIIPILFCLLPYIICLIKKKKYRINFSFFEIFIIILLWLLAYGGGENNVGRYVMHTLPLWLPLLSVQIVDFFKNFLRLKV